MNGVAGHAARQGLVAQLLTDRHRRVAVASGGAPDERMLAGDPGLLLSATLVVSFRVGKAVQLLPLTRAALGDVAFADHLDRFWSTHPPTSFYAPDEVRAFCEYLLAVLPDDELVRAAVEAEQARMRA